MYVSSRSELTIKFKKGCKDDQDFLDLQPAPRFLGLKTSFNAFLARLVSFAPAQFRAGDQIGLQPWRKLKKRVYQPQRSYADE